MEFDRTRLMRNISFLIKEKGIQVGKLENAVGISAGYLSKITKAENESMPGIDLIYKLAQQFEVSVEALVSGDFNKSNDNLLFIVNFIHSLEEDTNRHEFEWGAFASYDELREKYGCDELELFTQTVEVDMERSEAAFKYVSMFNASVNLTVTKNNYYALAPSLGMVLLFKLENHDADDRRAEYELYVIEDNGPGDEPLIPICSSLENNGEAAPYIIDLYNCIEKHEKDIKVSEEARRLINRYLSIRNLEELPFN